MMYRIRSKKTPNQSSEPPVYDLSAISQGDYIQASGTSSTDHLEPTFVPGGQKPMTVCYKTSSGENFDEKHGRIKREIGYQVTEHSAWRRGDV